MRFAYYQRLSAKDRATYRKSDAIPFVPLPDALSLKALLPPLAAALQTNDFHAVQRGITPVGRALCDQLAVPRIRTRVLAVRPAIEDDAELHGLYAWTPGETAVIRVWMRTAVHRRPVAFRTFLRTYLHELCHHLDFTLFALGESFHTEGFFRRESHLARQLLGDNVARDVSSSTPSRQLPLALPIDARNVR